MRAFRGVAAAALALGLGAIGITACGSHGGTATGGSTGTATTSGAPKNEATIVNLSCTATQLAQRQPAIVYRPGGLGKRKAPLVIALHGAFGTGRLMAELTGLEDVAARARFVAVFPSACDLRKPWGAGQDLYYLDSLIHAQIARNNVDPRRVYIAGFSAGGVEAYRAACMFSRDITAIAVVSEFMGIGIQRVCALSRPVSQLLMVGSADGNRWTGVPGRATSAVQTAAWWRQVDRCSSLSTVARPVARVIETTWPSCANGSRVALVEVVGAAHVWPPAGVGAPPDYNASKAVWSFLASTAAPS